MEVINPSDNVLDLGIFMFSNCSFELHINNLCKKCSKLSGWILRTFTTRESITMMTLFKSLVLSRLDYGSQLWSPHLVKHIDQLEKIQRSFTKHITGLHGLEYSERLVSLKLYSLQGVWQYMRIIIRADLWRLSINNSQTEFEYVKHMSYVVKFDTYTHTLPPALDMRSHQINEKPEIFISLSNIPSCKNFHRHKNKVDLSHKSYNTYFFLLV